MKSRKETELEIVKISKKIEKSEKDIKKNLDKMHRIILSTTLEIDAIEFLLARVEREYKKISKKKASQIVVQFMKKHGVKLSHRRFIDNTFCELYLYDSTEWKREIEEKVFSL